MLIKGDNLEALKALLPFYYNRIKAIYIDPPYNTGNENWRYNDNVSSPEIRSWLGRVVGGEAQRVKLATELSRRSTSRTLYILDEPTTGLSFEDVTALLQVLQRLADGGNTMIVIEHHLDVIKNADWIIDLGPGAGDYGGYIVTTGTPEEIAREKSSATGQYLGRVLARGIEPALTVNPSMDN